MSTTTQTKAPAVTSQFLFAQLAARIKDKPEVSQRIVAHVREVSGHSTLVSYHSNGASEAEKMEIYGACLKAIIGNDYSSLKGQVPKGQAQATEEQKPSQPANPVSYKIGYKTDGDKDWNYNGVRLATADEAKEYGRDLDDRWTVEKKWEVHPSDEPVSCKWENGALVWPKSEPKPEPAPVLKPEQTVTVTTPPQAVVPAVDPKMAAVIAALQALSPPATSTGVDEAAIRTIVRQVLAEELQKAVASQVEEASHTLKFELVAVIEASFKKQLKELAEHIAAGVGE